MTTLILQTESYLFENSERQFRAIPFYELSIDEFVVFEKDKPKYLIDFNRRELPLIQDFQTKLNNGEILEKIVWKLGRFLGKEWTTKHNISAREIPNSQQLEEVELILLSDLSEMFMDLTFVATDKIDFDILLNNQKLFDTYSTDTELLLESSFIDNYDNLVNMLTFIFKTNATLTRLTSNSDKDVFDLTPYKHQYITESELEDKYQEWIDIVERENTMDEYGNLLGVIGYINRNLDKKYLLLITEKRKHWQ